MSLKTRILMAFKAFVYDTHAAIKWMWMVWALVLFIIVSWIGAFILPYIPSTGNTLANSTIASLVVIAPFVYLWEKYIRKKAGPV